jgi:hypothetical protein
MRIGWGCRICCWLLLTSWVGEGVMAQRGKREQPEGDRRLSVPQTAKTSPFSTLVRTGTIGWERLLSDLRQLERTRDRVKVVELGRSTERRSMVALAISAPENLARLDEIREANRSRHSVRQGATETIGGEESLAKAMVVVTAGAGADDGEDLRQALALVDHLTASQTVEVVRILEEVVLWVVPAINPDGIDQAARQIAEEVMPTDRLAWAHPYLGSRLAEDWEVLSQSETSLLAERLFAVWRPHFWFDLRSRRLESSAPAADLPLVDNEDAAVRFARGQAIDYQRFVTGGDAMVVRLAQIAQAHAETLRSLPKELSSRASERTKTGPLTYLLPEPILPDSLQEAVTRLSQEMGALSGSEQEQHEQSSALVDEVSREPSSSSDVRYYYRTEGLDRLLVLLKRGGVKVFQTDQALTIDGRTYPVGTHIIPLRQPSEGFARLLLDGGSNEGSTDWRPGWVPLLLQVEVIPVVTPFEVSQRPEPPALVLQGRVRSNEGVEVGLYLSASPSIDAGWTRWVFDQYRFGYVGLTASEIRARRLRARFDTILLPAPDSHTGSFGLDQEALLALVEFVEAGGTLIAFDRASRWLVEQLKLPVRVREGDPLPQSLAPSVLRVEVDPRDPLAFGLGREVAIPWTGGLTFELIDSTIGRALAVYPSEGALVLGGASAPNLPRGGELALVELPRGKGRLLLFGFSPLTRGVSLSALPLLFNAIMTSGLVKQD